MSEKAIEPDAVIIPSKSSKQPFSQRPNGLPDIPPPLPDIPPQEEQIAEQKYQAAVETIQEQTAELFKAARYLAALGRGKQRKQQSGRLRLANAALVKAAINFDHAARTVEQLAKDGK